MLRKFAIAISALGLAVGASSVETPARAQGGVQVGALTCNGRAASASSSALRGPSTAHLRRQVGLLNIMSGRSTSSASISAMLQAEC